MGKEQRVENVSLFESGVHRSSLRPLKRNEFPLVRRHGRCFSGDRVSFFYILGGNAGLGVTITKKFGSACKRNRFKRVVRAAYRELGLTHFCCGIIDVHPKRGYESLSSDAVRAEFVRWMEFTQVLAFQGRC